MPNSNRVGVVIGAFRDAKCPITPRIPFHTIEGDRGRGDAPNSSDGVVSYWSSHLKGAQ